MRQSRRQALRTLAWGASCGALALALLTVVFSEAAVLITPEQAQHAAWQGFTAHLAVHPEALRQAGKGAEAATPLKVERLDRPGDFYYIVPFTREGRTTLLVLVDAQTGAFKEAAARSSDRPYPSLDETRARQLLEAALSSPADRQALAKVAKVHPDLAWKPSAPSQSPYEPFWRFRLDGDAGKPGKTWYVDALGHTFDQIPEVALKGGGPPPKGGLGRSPQ